MVRFMRFGRIFKFYEVVQPYLQYSLHVENKLPGERLLVIAPHPDDETIGAGGTVLLHTRSGKRADVVFCTTGEAVRKQEAREAARLLGVSDTVFLNYPVDSLAQQQDFPDRLISLFSEKKPDIVCLPFYIDNHQDHRAVNEALLRVAEKKKFDFLVYAYPVWSPLYPTVLIDTGSAWETKKTAISCYRSQLATRDYITMSYSLGQYWAKVKGRDLEVVETFFRASFSEYISLGRKLYGQPQP